MVKQTEPEDEEEDLGSIFETSDDICQNMGTISKHEHQEPRLDTEQHT